MSNDATSLSNLHDIVLPAATPWWPPAPGWLWLMAAAGFLLLVLALKALARYQANRYRREALAETQRLEAALAARDSRPQAMADLSVLLKRCALTAYPRTKVAELNGPAWFTFLDQSGATQFSGGPGQAMERLVFHADQAGCDAGQAAAVLRETRQWIRRHGPLPGGEGQDAE